MIVKMGIIHVIANCRDCAWESSDYLTAQHSAAEHAKKRKHVVLVEIAKAGTYDGKKEVKP